MLPAILQRLGLFSLGPAGILAAVLATHQIRARNPPQVTQEHQGTRAADVAGPSAAVDPSPLPALWHHAARGDAGAVRRLLRQHEIPPDTPHPDNGVPLVLYIANIATFSEQLDSDLAQILRVLGRAGWTLSVAAPISKDNALHMLSRQEWGYHVYHRMKILIDAEVENPKEDNMLAALNAAGAMPEGVAEVHRGDLVGYLNVQRLKIQIAVERGGGERRGLFGGMVGAWLSVRDVLSIGGGRMAEAG